MGHTFKEIHGKNIIVIIMATLMMILALFYVETEHQRSFAMFIGYALYYIVFLEISRTIVDYALDSQHRIKVKNLYDGGIVFIIREILVNATVSHHHIEKEYSYLIVMGIILTILVILRYVDYKLNPLEPPKETLMVSENDK